MTTLDDLTGRTFGLIKILKRAPNFKSKSGLKVQWVCLCLKCNQESYIVGTYLKRYIHRFKKGCQFCNVSFIPKKKKRNYKYGRNINGFIDKTKIIEINGENNEKN